MTLPGTRGPFWAKHAWLGELLLLTGAVISSIVGTQKVHHQLQAAHQRSMDSDGGPLRFDGLVWIVAGAACAISGGAVRVFEKRSTSKRNLKRDSPEDLFGCCVMLVGMLRVFRPHQEGCSLRITLYRVSQWIDGEPEELEQLTKYASEGAPVGTPGRTMKASIGIVGKAARSGEVIAANRVSDSLEDFYAEMVRDWGFTEKQAKGLNAGRWSWIAVPLRGSDGKVHAVLYMDSTERQYFSEDRVKEVVEATKCLNRFVEERYR